MADDRPDKPSASGGEEPKPLEVRVTELENAVRRITEVTERASGPGLLCRQCVECSCGPCSECSVCRVCDVCRVCRVCEVCRVCRVCETCFECSCGPCAR